VSLKSLICNVTELCPATCSCVNRPHNASFEVSCPPGTLESLPHRLPNPSKPVQKYLLDLRFSGSSMKSLESRDYFVNTSILDVSTSQIETITDEAWRSLQTVHRVDLSGNRLTTLPRFLQTENIKYRRLDLHGNPLSCECDQRWLATWLKSSSLHHSYSVVCHSPDWLKGRSIRSLNNDDYCQNPQQERVLYVLKVRSHSCFFITYHHHTLKQYKGCH